MNKSESLKTSEIIFSESTYNLFDTVNNMIVDFLFEYEIKKAIALEDLGIDEAPGASKVSLLEAYFTIFETILSENSNTHDLERVKDSLNSIIKNDYHSVVSSRLELQKNAIVKNNALLRFKDSNSFEWYYLPQNVKPSDDHLSAVNALTTDYILDVDWAEELNYHDKNLIENAEILVLGRVQKLMNIMDSKAPWSDKFAGGINYRLEDQARQSGAALVEMIDICKKIYWNLPLLLIEHIKQDPKLCNYIKRAIESRVDEQIAFVNEAFVPPELSRKEKKALKAAEYALKKLSSSDIDDYKQVVVEGNHISKAEESTTQSKELVFSQIGEIEYEFPWLKSKKKLDVTHIRGGVQDVVLIRALSPKLEKISKVVRDGLPKNSSGEDKIDQTLKQVTKRIAGGIMPYEDTNSVKRLSTDKKDLHIDYQDKTIWYSFDVSPNSPRVYFTINEINEITSYKELPLSTNKVVEVVILAEADKARQLDTLGRLTSLDRSTLRARGAGSI